MALLQKRPIILKSLLIAATPEWYTYICPYITLHTYVRLKKFCWNKSPLGTPFSKVSFIAILYSHFGRDTHIYMFIHIYACEWICGEIRFKQSGFWESGLEHSGLWEIGLEEIGSWEILLELLLEQLLRNSIGLKQLVKNEWNKAAFEKFYRNTADFEKQSGLPIYIYIHMCTLFCPDNAQNSAPFMQSIW